MRIIFVRHGDPDYTNDSLTELGKKEALLLSARLAELPIKAIYSSPYGRAHQTAEYLSSLIKLPIKVKDFLRETPCRYENFKGEEFFIRDRLPTELYSDPNIYDIHTWMENEDIKNSSFPARIKEINEGIDEILKDHGYIRDGEIYKVLKPNHDIIVIFSHFGCISACLSHLFNISPELLWHHIVLRPSSVTMLFSEERREGEAIFRASQIGDISHLDDGDRNPNLHAQFAECYEDFDKRHD